MASHEGDRAVALSVQLAQAHQELRRQISELRAGLGQPGAQGDTFGLGWPRTSGDTLVAHCLAFCGALTEHHQGEDEGMFAQLLSERPDLAGTVTNLVEDHGMIAAILTRVRELAHDAAELPSTEALTPLARELDGLAAIMESHFAYEERTLGEALNAAAPNGNWPTQVFRFTKP